jgi:hypothetical protein
MLKRPVRLTKDDMDLKGNYLSHTTNDRLDRGSHFDHFSDVFMLLPLLQLSNAMLISLRMLFFHSKLTSLISQALLQAALDKEPKGLNGSVLHNEFLSLPLQEGI